MKERTTLDSIAGARNVARVAAIAVTMAQLPVLQARNCSYGGMCRSTWPLNDPLAIRIGNGAVCTLPRRIRYDKPLVPPLISLEEKYYSIGPPPSTNSRSTPGHPLLSPRKEKCPVDPRRIFCATRYRSFSGPESLKRVARDGERLARLTLKVYVILKEQ
ncbi:uncharacterized protein LOC143179374 [Calliopsis andreniformis]|uniref:uncharacterized protein LOC143179374 n=1 Tax=Calliopsis andreniformis TaxID=337506 RepID=UPI003FCC603A